ncbi:MAG: MBL fold metallo-hydrolase [Myxococcales bacterium]|nr:MBL fold metallo-hydrolase [Myxococcales bacterium]
MTPFTHKIITKSITAINTGDQRDMMISSHLMTHEGHALFVDCGTNHCVPRLLEVLHEKGFSPKHVDYVILTHIHLDHAGGAGTLMQALPHAKLLVHPRGQRHMIDPSKLFAGATAVYGEAFMLENYGELLPIDADRIITPADDEVLDWHGRPLRFLHTEGHAKHHFCIWDAQSKHMFTGDTFGLSYREFDTAHGAFIFPTTTPVHFDPQAMHASIDRLLTYQPEGMLLTHFSQVRNVSRHAERLHQQIDDFVAMAQANPSQDALAEKLMTYLIAQLREHGVTLPDAQCKAVLQIDVDINAQGLLFWLEHVYRKQA